MNFKEVELLLAELAVLLQDGDAEAVERLGDLQEYLSGSEVEEQMKTLEEYVNTYDFETAQITLAKITMRLNTVLNA